MHGRTRVKWRKGQASSRKAWFEIAALLFLTIGVSGVSLYILIAPEYSHDTQKTAAGFLGSVIGYWLR